MLPSTEPELDAFLLAFESGTLPKKRWTHAAHLLTGACYVHRLGQTAAIDQMRRCVRHFNESVGGKNTATSGYHETITLFWIKVLDALLQQNPTLTRAHFAALAVARFEPRRDLLRRFYDFDVAASTEARATWIPPTQGDVLTDPPYPHHRIVNRPTRIHHLVPLPSPPPKNNLVILRLRRSQPHRDRRSRRTCGFPSSSPPSQNPCQPPTHPQTPRISLIPLKIKNPPNLRMSSPRFAILK